MKDELRTYYERELTYLREAGTEFAAKYPKIAGRLALAPDGSTDPHVERLLEGVAMLTARVRRKIDDELPEVTDSLLGILYPHFLTPIPSMAVVQFHLDEAQGQPAGGYEIPRHTMLTTRPVEGVRLRFRTGYPVRLWPIEVADAALERQLTAAPLGARRAFRARAAVRLRLRAAAGTRLSALAPAALRFHLQGESALTHGLYEMLCGGPVQVELHGPRRDGAETAIVLEPPAVRPVGFAPDETLLPYPAHSFRAYTLLDEYFCFPQKFMFFDLHGLARAREVGAEDEVEVRIFCGRAPRFDQDVRGTTFRLGCTPLVNLFPKPAEPIWVDHTKAEYLIVPDVHHPHAYETHTVDSVIGSGDEPGQQRTFRPFYALRHGASTDAPDTFWHLTREEALDGASDAHLSLLDGNLRATSPAVETLSLQLTCTNRDLPAQVRFSGQPGADFDSENVAPFVRIQCIDPPTPARRRAPGRRAHWRLVSHLALNYLSVADHGPEALQAILELYDPTGSEAARRQIEGIRDVRSERIVRVVNGALCRGIRVTVDFDREHYVGTSPYLLAAVLDRFLGLYASINSFTQLVARMPPDEEPLHTWPPRAGELALV
jgi:type VI secretion system protein ImpG